MKKFLIVVILFSVLLFGCKKETKPFELDEEFYNKSGVTKIDAEKFKKLEADKKNFALFIYLPGCTACASFSIILNDYSKQHNIAFYSITMEEKEKTSINENITLAPSLALFKDGELVEFLDSNADEDIPFFKTQVGFEKWFSKYIIIK